MCIACKSRSRSFGSAETQPAAEFGEEGLLAFPGGEELIYDAAAFIENDHENPALPLPAPGDDRPQQGEAVVGEDVGNEGGSISLGRRGVNPLWPAHDGLYLL